MGIKIPHKISVSDYHHPLVSLFRSQTKTNKKSLFQKRKAKDKDTNTYCREYSRVSEVPELMGNLSRQTHEEAPKYPLDPHFYCTMTTLIDFLLFCSEVQYHFHYFALIGFILLCFVWFYYVQWYGQLLLEDNKRHYGTDFLLILF